MVSDGSSMVSNGSSMESDGSYMMSDGNAWCLTEVLVDVFNKANQEFIAYVHISLRFRKFTMLQHRVYSTVYANFQGLSIQFVRDDKNKDAFNCIKLRFTQQIYGDISKICNNR
jgi:hypothetical protein